MDGKETKKSFKGISKTFQIKDSAWIFPQAPYPLEEEDSFSWTYEISPGKYEREEPIELLLNFFEKEIFSRFSSTNVFLFGFSQGALVCFEMIKLLKIPIGGFFPISGFMAETKKNIHRVHESQINTPVIIGHGVDDEVIPIEASRTAGRLLSMESNNILIEEYKGGHKISLSYMKKNKGAD